MSTLISGLGLPEIVAALMVVALNAYVLTGGADFGGGVWDLAARGPRRDAQRDLIADSIAPIWEANHVWLIVVVVMLFTGFPAVYATLGTVLHLPLTLLLVGIVLRGSAFVFRSYGSHTGAQRRRWGLAFAVASLAAPVLLGVVVGALASGNVSDAASRVSTGTFVSVYVTPWLSTFTLLTGLFALALFAFLAAVYLALAAGTADLANDFRARALGMALVVFVLAGAALLAARSGAPRVMRGVMGAPWSLGLHLVTGAAAVVAIAALWRRSYAVARIAAAAQVSLILWGWVLAQYPYVIPQSLTIRQAAAPRATLVLLVVGLAVGAAILIPSLRYLFQTFGARSRATPASQP